MSEYENESGVRKKTEKKPLERIIELTIIVSLLCLVVDFFGVLFFRNCIKLTNNAVISEIMRRLPKYTDIFLTVYVAIIVALLTITITVYVSLKSALDRLIDENQYNANVASIYQDESSKKLFEIAIYNIAPVIIAVFWHLILQFQDIHLYWFVFIGILAGLFNLLLVILRTFLFWKECINVRERLRNIRLQEIQECRKEIKKDIGDEKSGSTEEKAKRDKILLMLGYWTEWDTDDCDSKLVEVVKENESEIFGKLGEDRRGRMVDAGIQLCKELAVDQYINLFSRIEDLMLAGGQQSEAGHVSENDIVTIIQDRNSILEPIIGKNAHVEGKDLEEKKYEMNHVDRGKVNAYIQAFRREVGYDNDSDDNTVFYQSTEHLYKVLRRYRNLVISESIDSSKHESKVNNGSIVASDKNKKVDIEAAIGLYYFLLRVLAVFVSSIHVDNFTFNGNSLSFANFYNSSLENVNLYSTQFYHTVFARTRLIQDVLDLSQFDNIYFYNTRIANTSINNATYDHVMFDSVQAGHSGFNISIFTKCDFENSTFKDCFFNDSRFKGCTFKNISFDGSSMLRNIFGGVEKEEGEIDCGFEGCSFEGCSFVGARIEKWDLKSQKNGMRMNFSDFSEADIEDIDFINANLNGSNFSKASLVNVKFQECRLNESLFSEAMLPNCEFEDCRDLQNKTDPSKSLIRSSFTSANMFGAVFKKCDLEKSTFYMANAAYASFEDCNLANGDCSEITLREAVLCRTVFDWALLYNATLSWSKVDKCRFNYTIADHIQFTYANCENASFDYSTMSESNISGTKFAGCSFRGTDLTGNVAYETTLESCKFIQTDFSDTRFLNVKFIGGTYRNVKFSDCSFEESEFTDVTFENCELSGAIFTSCSFKSLTIKNCTLTSENKTTYIGRRSINSLCHVTEEGTPKVIRTHQNKRGSRRT